MSKAGFYFTDVVNPSTYNIIRTLEQYAIQASCLSLARLSDQTFALSPKACSQLEYKHQLHHLVQGTSYWPESYYIDEHNVNQVLSYLTEKYYTVDQQLIEQQPNIKWILKPSLLNNGEQILLFDNIARLWDHYTFGQRLGGPHLLQRYITKPLLLDNRKFSIRLFVVVSRKQGVFLYPQGYFNQALTTYTADELTNRSAHLTNEHLAHTEKNVQQIPLNTLSDADQIIKQAQEIICSVIKLLDKQHKGWRKKQNAEQLAIFGFDFMQDTQKKLWLLEINHGPCFPTTEEHELKSCLFSGFWVDFTRQFILPLFNNPQQKNSFIRLCKAMSRLYLF